MFNLNYILYGAMAILISFSIAIWFLYTATLNQNAKLKTQVAQYELTLKNKEKEINFLKELDQTQLNLIFEGEQKIDSLEKKLESITDNLNSLNDNESSIVLKELMRMLKGDQK